ncbi:putative lipoprotein/NMB1164 precursor [bacterium BMS3Bbin11]|nr:putative lipoprotein/NMB1164 precursor [bacterium BMS3Abin11]GBE45544.1 putative lipoprotein/NMB1164 precursor [bacterium BMS3Bbin11]GMT40817.1 MAG: hypothetical protein IEMM0001_1552 [bacterium]
MPTTPYKETFPEQVSAVRGNFAYMKAFFTRIAVALFIAAVVSPSYAADCDPDFDSDCEHNVSSQASRIASYPSYHGPKQVVAVLPFANRVKNVYGSWQLGEGLAEILVTELVKSGRFLVVERESIRGIISEQELGLSGLVRKETAVKTGQMSGAQFYIKGAITEFNDQAGGGGITLGFKGGEVGGKTRTAYVGIDVRIVDNTTGQIYASYNASAKARSTGASLSTNLTNFGDLYKLGASGFNSTALGVATRKAVQKIMGFILAESKNIPWQGSIIKAGSKVYLNRGDSAGVKNGDRLAVYSKGEALIDPETGFNLGSDERLICSVFIVQSRPKFSIARMTPDCQGQGIKRGDIVRYQ